MEKLNIKTLDDIKELIEMSKQGSHMHNGMMHQSRVVSLLNDCLEVAKDIELRTLKLALQKHIPQKPIETEDEGFICPACEGGCLYPPDVTDNTHAHCNYCNECGQKLDWE